VAGTQGDFSPVFVYIFVPHHFEYKYKKCGCQLKKLIGAGTAPIKARRDASRRD